MSRNREPKKEWIGVNKRAPKGGFGLPTLFVLGWQKILRKQPPGYLVGEKIIINLEDRMGRGWPGPTDWAPVFEIQPAGRKAREPRPHAAPYFPFPSLPCHFKEKGGTARQKGASPGSARKRQRRGGQRCAQCGSPRPRTPPPGPQRRLGSCHSSPLKPKKTHS